MASVAELKGAIAQAGEEAEQAVQLLVEAGGRAESALQFLVSVAQGSDHESLEGSLGAMGQAVESIGECQAQIGAAIDEANKYSEGL
ncbi:MAG: hypothetical protein JWP48_5842 [Actinoallomurus sp.]|jgi:hypothetical protein|nr:hypothetical protein [Actinoallomurus sp.]